MPGLVIGTYPISMVYRFRFRAMAGEHEIQLAGGDAAAARRAAEDAIADVAAHRGQVLALSRRQRHVAHQPRRPAARRLRSTTKPHALLHYADQCHAQSDGLFDITSGVLRRAWDFRREPPRVPAPPSSRSCFALIAGATSNGRAQRAPAARRHGDRLRRHRQGIRGRPRRDDPARARHAPRLRQSGRRHSRDRPAAGRHAVARGHPASARRGRRDRRRSISWMARWPRAATTSAISTSTASAIATSSIRGRACRSTHGNR